MNERTGHLSSSRDIKNVERGNNFRLENQHKDILKAINMRKHNTTRSQLFLFRHTTEIDGDKNRSYATDINDIDFHEIFFLLVPHGKGKIM